MGVSSSPAEAGTEPQGPPRTPVSFPFLSHLPSNNTVIQKYPPNHAASTLCASAHTSASVWDVLPSTSLL